MNSIVGADVYRLPVEAEWEYAAYAGTTTRFAQGDELTADQANFSRVPTENVRQYTHPNGMPHLAQREKPVPVDMMDAANGWGLRHMSRNVGELTQSCWTETHISLTSSREYLAITAAHQIRENETSDPLLVAQGGDWRYAMDGLRPAARTRPALDRRSNYLGFRIVRDMR